jgi:hypothetical protein
LVVRARPNKKRTAKDERPTTLHQRPTTSDQPPTTNDPPRTTDDPRPSPTEKASEEVLLFEGFGELLGNERPARLVFLFLGGFLLGCHEVYPSVLNDFYSPKVLDKAP